ncbi:hypothetical protein D3C87_1565560 [compost metagenome]
MLRQLFGQAEAHAHTVAEPDKHGGEQAPDHQNHGKGKDDRQPFIGRHDQGVQFVPGEIVLFGPARERAVCTGKLLLQTGKRSTDQPEHTLFGGGLGLFGGIAQLFQVGQQLGSLLIVLQRLDDFVQGLPQGFLRLWLGFRRTAEHARQADCLGRGQRQQRHEADEEEGWQGKKTSEH